MKLAIVLSELGIKSQLLLIQIQLRIKLFEWQVKVGPLVCCSSEKLEVLFARENEMA